ESFLRAQYSQLGQEMRVRGLSGAVFTELAGYEQELGTLTYDRRAYTMSPSLLQRLNRRLIALSQQAAALRAQPPAIAAPSAGLWGFDQRGSAAADSSGHGPSLSLRGGARWRVGSPAGPVSIPGHGE